MAKYLIETITLDSSASSITFSNIPQDYTDLILVCSMRIDRTGRITSGMALNINASSANQSLIRLQGGGSSVASGSGSIIYLDIPAVDATTNTFGSGSIYISNYASTGQEKSISIDSVSENNATTADTSIRAALFDNTSAITSLTLRDFDNVGSFIAGSTASLYGWTAGNDGSTTVS